MSFVSLVFDLRFAIVIAVFNSISRQTWPHYNGTGCIWHLWLVKPRTWLYNHKWCSHMISDHRVYWTFPFCMYTNYTWEMYTNLSWLGTWSHSNLSYCTLNIKASLTCPITFAVPNLCQKYWGTHATFVDTFGDWVSDNSRVSCQKGPTRHAYAWHFGPFGGYPRIMWKQRPVSMSNKTSY